jgi:hypothetical protein
VKAGAADDRVLRKTARHFGDKLLLVAYGRRSRELIDYRDERQQWRALVRAIGGQPGSTSQECVGSDQGHDPKTARRWYPCP